MTDHLLDALGSAVGPGHVLVDHSDTRGYEVDWTGRFSGRAAAVVRPADTAEVQAVMRICAAHNVGVVPQGGNTGLVGGGVPRGGEVLISLRRLDAVGTVAAAVPSIQVGAGATLASVDVTLRSHGLAVGVDLAARESATIGGMVATNAGGTHVVAHGSMRHRVLGLEAVLADGSVLDRLPGLVKDNAGYDLTQLLAGSEGTLGIITAVNLRPVSRPVTRTVVMIGCDDFGDAISVTAASRRQPGLLAAEVMTAAGVTLVCQADNLPVPLPGNPPVLLLLEFGHIPDEAWLAGLVAERDATLAQDETDARRLWHYREAHTEAISRQGVALKLDVTVPLVGLADFVHQVDQVAGGAVIFGHLAEGTLHVNILDPGAGIQATVLHLVAEHGGSIASEHGVGVAKAPYLHLTRSRTERAMMRSLKQALDPAGLLNPGVILVE